MFALIVPVLLCKPQLQCHESGTYALFHSPIVFERSKHDPPLLVLSPSNNDPGKVFNGYSAGYKSRLEAIKLRRLP